MSKSVNVFSNVEEIRVLIFRLEETEFAVDVLMIREIIKQVKATELPNSPWGIEGVFKLRDEVIPLVKLGEYLGFKDKESAQNEGAIIIVETCGVKYGILVDAVDVIKAVPTSEVMDPSDFIRDTDAPIKATIEVDKKTIQLPDLDKITNELFSTDNMKTLEKSGVEFENAPQAETNQEQSSDEGTPTLDTIMDDLPVEEMARESEMAAAELSEDKDKK